MLSRAAFFCLIALVAMAACDDLAPPTDISPASDSLSVNTPGLSATLRAGSDSTTQSFIVTAQRPGVAWTASSSAPWLRLSPTSGVTPGVVNVTILTGGLPPGEHSAIVTLTSPSAGGAPVTATVRLTVLPQPVLAVSPTTASFSAVVGQGGTNNVILTIDNSGSGQLEWAAVASAPWITLVPSSGSAPSVLAVGVNTTGLAAGTHTGTVSVTAAGALASPATIPVTVVLTNPPRANISTSALPANGGTTSGGGSFAAGTSVTVSAAASPGYAFRSWTENGAVLSTSASYTFTASGDRALVANFEAAPTITITTSSSPAAGGATSGGGSFPTGTSVTVNAQANTGYTFTNWTENGIVVSTSASHTFPAATNRTLVANFAASTVVITTSSNPPAGGTTSGGGTHAIGSSVTVTAVPASGYAFTGWAQGGAIVSTSPSYTFPATANRALVANFTAAQQGNVTIATASNPAVGGSTAGGGSYASGTSVTVTATPNSGHTFSSWTESGTVASTSASYTFIATANRTLVANFTPVQQGNVTIGTSSSPVAGGSTTGGGSYAPGTSVTVTATPSSGYAFSNWTEGGSVVSTSASYTFTATANRTLVANFAPTSPTSFTVSTSSSPPAGGTTTGGGSYASGTSVTVTATPASGYTFTNWTEAGTVVSTSPSYTFTVTASRALVANFTAGQAGNVVITTRSNPPDGGVTNGAQSVPPGTSVTVTAFPSGQNVFSNWTEGSTVVSQSATYTFTAVANRDLVANFAPIVVTGFTFCCGTLVDGLEEFNMGIRSASPVASARVEFGGRTAPVTYNVAFSRWEGWADFTGLPKGEIPLTGIAKTINGDSATLTRIMFNDPLPSLTVAAPVDGEVARPSLPYSVSCTDDPDDLPCQISISVEGGPPAGQVASGTGSVSGTLNLAAHEGRVVSLFISATAPNGRFSWLRRQVYVESSPRLIAAGSADGTILDILGGRVLYRTTSGPPLAIRTLATGAIEVIQTPAGRAVGQAFLHPAGAIVDLTSPRTFHDWRSGTLTTICSANCTGLEVDSPFALYNVGNVLHRLDLRSGVSSLITSGAGNTSNDVAPDGSVAYWGAPPNYNIYWYRAGVTTAVTQSGFNVEPVTDGRSVVFKTRNASESLWRIMMHDGAAATELAGPRPEPGMRIDYNARNGWIAFTREVSGAEVLWTRSPSGELRQASAPASTSGVFGVMALADDGGVMLRANTRLLLVNAGGTAQDVSSTNGTAVWRDGEFYLMLGRTVWRIQR